MSKLQFHKSVWNQADGTTQPIVVFEAKVLDINTKMEFLTNETTGSRRKLATISIGNPKTGEPMQVVAAVSEKTLQRIEESPLNPDSTYRATATKSDTGTVFFQLSHLPYSSAVSIDDLGADLFSVEEVNAAAKAPINA